MKAEDKDILWHIKWGDGDTTFAIAPDKEAAIKQMGDGKDMGNTIVGLHAIYGIIKGRGIREGRQEVVEFIMGSNKELKFTRMAFYINGKKWQAKLKKWGIE